MKRLLFLIFLTSVFTKVNSQNVQLHYDFGEDRKMFTSTIEMFKPDDWGNTFFFFDMDYGAKASEVDGVNLAYLEISREIKLWEPPILFHAEFNGGMFRTNSFSGALNNAWLAGGTYAWNNDDFSKTFSFMVLYKYIKDKHDASFQLTAVWGVHFLDRKLSFTGFADFWREDNVVFDNDANLSETDYVFLTEPQLWYNITEQLAVGSELEISSNFAANKGFMINPTLALKWTFN